jgi:hypothetical protein
MTKHKGRTRPGTEKDGVVENCPEMEICSEHAPPIAFFGVKLGPPFRFDENGSPLHYYIPDSFSCNGPSVGLDRSLNRTQPKGANYLTHF